MRPRMVGATLGAPLPAALRPSLLPRGRHGDQGLLLGQRQAAPAALLGRRPAGGGSTAAGTDAADAGQILFMGQGVGSGLVSGDFEAGPHQESRAFKTCLADQVRHCLRGGRWAGRRQGHKTLEQQRRQHRERSRPAMSDQRSSSKGRAPAACPSPRAPPPRAGRWRCGGSCCGGTQTR